jgi:hypothetical protein
MMNSSASAAPNKVRFDIDYPFALNNARQSIIQPDGNPMAT